MFCQKCYTDLRNVYESRCPTCGRIFDPANPRTYLRRPFPDTSAIIGHIIGTTIAAVVVAAVVAFFQMANASGH